MSFKETFIRECIAICKHENIQDEFINNIIKPVYNYVLEDINPYITFTMIYMIINIVFLFILFTINIYLFIKYTKFNQKSF